MSRFSPDAAVRRHALLIVLVGTCVGAFLIVAFERYRIPLRDWLLADPEASARKVYWVVLLLALALCAPLLALGAYLWALGEKVAQGRLLKLLSLGCGIACAALGLLLWRLVSVMGF